MPAPWLIALWKAFFGALAAAFAGAFAGAAPAGAPDFWTTNICSGRLADAEPAASAAFAGDAPGSLAVGFDLPSLEGLAASMRFQARFSAVPRKYCIIKVIVSLRKPAKRMRRRFARLRKERPARRFAQAACSAYVHQDRLPFPPNLRRRAQCGVPSLPPTNLPFPPCGAEQSRMKSVHGIPSPKLGED